jgi:dephospho-CoA kinase
MKKMKPIYKLGVTGGIGSGKSTVCKVFERLGVPVLFADDISKEISTTHPIIKKKIITLLGVEAYTADGMLNRQYIASKIFSNKALQKKIESILHPQVEKEIEHRIAALQQAGHRLAIIEAALLFEAGLDKKMDAVLVLDADESVRVQRVQRRDGASEKDIRARMKAQSDARKNAAKADYVFHNNGSPEELATNARFLYSIVTHLVDEE